MSSRRGARSGQGGGRGEAGHAQAHEEGQHVDFCVSQEEGEVIAIGLKVTSADAEITVATKSDVPQATKKHLRQIWQAMKNIAWACHHQQPPQSSENTPPKTSINDRVRDQLFEFAKLCLSHSFQK